jgi:hypothetical protein
MSNEIIFIVDGEEIITTVPNTEATPNVKSLDTGLHTLTTKNSLKLSVHVQKQLGLKPLKDENGEQIKDKDGNNITGDKVGYSKSGDRIFIFKTEEENGKAVTNLGSNKSYVRLNYAQLWKDLKGNEKTTLKYELGKEAKSKDNKITAYELVFVTANKKQASTAPATTGKGKGSKK